MGMDYTSEEERRWNERRGGRGIAIELRTRGNRKSSHHRLSHPVMLTCVCVLQHRTFTSRAVSVMRILYAKLFIFSAIVRLFEISSFDGILVR